MSFLDCIYYCEPALLGKRDINAKHFKRTSLELIAFCGPVILFACMSGDGKGEAGI